VTPKGRTAAQWSDLKTKPTAKKEKTEALLFFLFFFPWRKKKKTSMGRVYLHVRPPVPMGALGRLG